MNPAYVVKFVSVDGLTRFEHWKYEGSAPQEEIIRRGIHLSLSLRCVAVTELTEPSPPPVTHRTYRLYDKYIDETTSSRVFEYREHV